MQPELPQIRYASQPSFAEQAVHWLGIIGLILGGFGTAQGRAARRTHSRIGRRGRERTRDTENPYGLGSHPS